MMIASMCTVKYKVISSFETQLLPTSVGLNEMMILALHFVFVFTQLHGAAYGKGIYLSPVSTVSFGYTGYYGSGKAEVCGSHLACSPDSMDAIMYSILLL